MMKKTKYARASDDMSPYATILSQVTMKRLKMAIIDQKMLQFFT